MAVGRAIVREPKVFLFDEPLSNLDAKLRVETRAKISKLHQRLQTTFIYVTHDQTEAMTMATRIAVINKGILQQLDTPQTPVRPPDNLFVAGFIGSPAMNFFPANFAQRWRKAIRGWRLLLRANSETAKAPIFMPLAGKPVIFGIRPEDIHNPLFAPPASPPNLWRPRWMSPN